MELPVELTELLAELAEEEPFCHTVTAEEDGRAVIYLDAESEDGASVELDSAQCRLVFRNARAVRDLVDALGQPERASIVLHNVEPPTAALDEMERLFVAVDEE